MADHTAGAAAGTLRAANEIGLTVEFKINLLRPAKAERLRSQAKVIKTGRRICMAESEGYAVEPGEPKLVSKATVTLAFILYIKK